MDTTVNTYSNELTIDNSSKTVGELKKDSKRTPGRLVSILEYVLFLLVILEFNTAYLEYEPLKKNLLNVTIFLCLLLLFLIKRPFKLDGILIVYFLGSFLPFLNIYPGAEKHYIKLYWLIIPLFMLYFLSLRRVGFDQITSFLLKYSNIVTLLALISLFYWVFGSNLGLIQPTMYVPNSWKGDGISLIPTYHFIYFETQESSFMGFETVRNSGIFNEGPMYNMILCVALAMELFLRSHKSIWSIIIIWITIVTTFTTTGYLFLTFISAWIIFKFFSQKSRVLLLALLPLLAIGVMTFSDTIMDEKESSSGESSVRARTVDILTCIEVGMENPFLGQGLFTKKAGENEGGTYGFSNSLFTLFADGGFYTVFLYLAALVLIPLRDFLSNRQNTWPLMMFAFFLVFTVTASHFNCLTLLFVAFGCSMFPRELV
jgi:hypothetical protein